MSQHTSSEVTVSENFEIYNDSNLSSWRDTIDKNKGGNTILQLNKDNGKTERNYDTMHACKTYTCKTN